MAIVTAHAAAREPALEKPPSLAEAGLGFLVLAAERLPWAVVPGAGAELGVGLAALGVERTRQAMTQASDVAGRLAAQAGRLPGAAWVTAGLDERRRAAQRSVAAVRRRGLAVIGSARAQVLDVVRVNVVDEMTAWAQRELLPKMVDDLALQLSVVIVPRVVDGAALQSRQDAAPHTRRQVPPVVAADPLTTRTASRRRQVRRG
jgi:hypothetical protein